MTVKTGHGADVLAFASEQNEQLMALEREIRAAVNKADDKKEEIESVLRRRLMRRTVVVSGPLRAEQLMRSSGLEHVESYREVRDREFVVRYIHCEHYGREGDPPRLAPLVTATYKEAVDRGQPGGDVTFWLLQMHRFDPVDDRP